jgi:hypothetical protein
MLRYIALSFLLLLNAGPAFSQWHCLSDELHQKRMADNPRYAASVARSQAAWARHIAADAYAKKEITGKDTVYEIPTVIHIVHTGGAPGSQFNPSDAEIRKMLDYINGAWQANWPGFLDTAHGGKRMPFRFVLVKRDANCNPVTGIDRVDGSGLPGYTDYGICPFGTVPGPSDADVKNLSLWPVQDFYNIWIVNAIENGLASGYAPWPWYTSADLIDGAVIIADAVRPGAGGGFAVTAPHEIGHNFGLYHTFQDGCSNTFCTTEGDEICDTEPNEYLSFDCKAGMVNSCTGVTYAGVEHNVMNYTTCPDRFTEGQHDRILFTQRSYRMGLANSLGSVAPDPSFITPAAACLPGITFGGNTDDVGPRRIQLSNMVTQSGGYNGDNNTTYLNRTCIQEAARLVQGDPYTLSVTTGNSIENVRVWIDYNNDGAFAATELVLSHNGTTGSETHTATVTAPVTATINRPLRMRVRSDAAISLLTDPCLDQAYGQTEDYSVIITPKPTSIAGADQPRVKIYPNPAKDMLWLEATGPVQAAVYSMEGKLLLQQVTSDKLDISMLASGLYLLRLSDVQSGAVLQYSKINKGSN